MPDERGDKQRHVRASAIESNLRRTAMNTVQEMTVDQLAADRDWWAIYEDSFPTNEREPEEVILKSLRSGDGMAFRARRGETTSGLATTHLLTDPAAVFLIYLAAARTERSHGIGAELFEAAWEMGKDRLRTRGLSPRGLIWEVDPPEATAEDAANRERRIAFFRRRGGEILETPYLQPPVDRIAAVPMSLMFRTAEGEAPPAGQEVDALVRAIYYQKYGAVNGIDQQTLRELLSLRLDQ
jgi:GNAT superfamily N-acetyltransferase